MARTLPTPPPRELKGFHVFWIIVAFFAAFIVADIFFVMRAVATFPGEQVKKSYVVGLDYNTEVARKAQQAKLGWSAEAGVEDGSVIVRLNDADGRPLTNLDARVAVLVYGVKTEAPPVVLAERAAGEYTAPLDIQAPARIEMKIEARRSGEEAFVFEAVKTLSVP